MRREFSKQVRRDAFARAKGCCEGTLASGQPCGGRLGLGKYHYDHIIPDGNGGEPTLANCAVLCIACHRHKTTTEDVPAIAKTKRIRDKHIGIRTTRPKIQSRGFAKAPPQCTASRPIERRQP